jgi:chloramphenicol-sensitive protein RarD
MPPARLVGFVLVWAALVLLSIDGLRTRQRTRRSNAAEPAPVRV